MLLSTARPAVSRWELHHPSLGERLARHRCPQIARDIWYAEHIRSPTCKARNAFEHSRSTRMSLLQFVSAALVPDPSSLPLYCLKGHAQERTAHPRPVSCSWRRDCSISGGFAVHFALPPLRGCSQDLCATNLCACVSEVAVKRAMLRLRAIDSAVCHHSRHMLSDSAKQRDPVPMYPLSTAGQHGHDQPCPDGGGSRCCRCAARWHARCHGDASGTGACGRAAANGHAAAWYADERSHAPAAGDACPIWHAAVHGNATTGRDGRHAARPGSAPGM